MNWIKVEDGLPDTGKRINFRDIHNREFKGRIDTSSMFGHLFCSDSEMGYCENCGHEIREIAGGAYVPADITHWQYLTEPTGDE